LTKLAAKQRSCSHCRLITAQDYVETSSKKKHTALVKLEIAWTQRKRHPRKEENKENIAGRQAVVHMLLLIHG